MSRSDRGSPSKRQRRNDADDDATTGKKKHLYLALDDWKGGCSIHKLDADNMQPSGHLTEPAALRLAGPLLGHMAFAAVGTSIFIDTVAERRYYGIDSFPQTLVYSTKTGALTLGPHVPDGLFDLGGAMAVGERLYAVTTVYRQPPSLKVLSMAPNTKLEFLTCIPTMDWFWNSLPTSTPPFNGDDIVTYALHPDGSTIFVSTKYRTHSFDSSHGVWRELGDWVLPFRGQAYFDADIDGWVGIHRKEDGYICCCPVASRSATTTPRLKCRMLIEKLFRSKEEVKPGHQHLKPTLTYMGDSRYCLIENVVQGEDEHEGSVLNVTLFGLKYDHRGELQTKVRRTSRSYTVSKNTIFFSHAAFWM